VHWGCDEFTKGEEGAGTFASTGLRETQHSMLEFRISKGQKTQEQIWAMLHQFDWRWSSSITSYTLCNLTKHTDKLIAVSSIARELANTQILKRRYLAGLWDINLPFQLAWITVKGSTTPPRESVVSAEYVAPSWSWASVEAPVQKCSIFNTGQVALADVLASDVALKTDFVFGSVKGGWLRVRGQLNHILSAQTKSFYNWEKDSQQTSLKDKATGENLWLCSDTVEGGELVKSRKNLEKMKWMPLTLRYGPALSCNGLVLMEVQAEEEIGREYGFVKAGEKVYRRLGSCDFGRIPSMLKQDKLLMNLGTWPDIQVVEAQVQGPELVKGFKRKEDKFEEFVLI